MLQAIKLEQDVATRLPKPSVVPSTHLPNAAIAASQQNKKTPSSRVTQETMFKSISEEFVTDHNLLWVPWAASMKGHDCPCIRLRPERRVKRRCCSVCTCRCGVVPLKISHPLEMGASSVEEIALSGAKK